MTLGQGQGITLTLKTHVISYTNFQTTGCNSFWKIQGLDFFSYKSHCEQIWPWPKIGRGHPGVIIWTNYNWLESPMLNTKFHDNRPTSLGEVDYGMAAILVKWPNSY